MFVNTEVSCFTFPLVFLSLSLPRLQQAPDPPITVSSSPASSAYGDACDHPNNTEGEDDEEEEEEEEDMMEDTVMDTLSLDGDFSHDDSARKAMKEPLSE